MAKAKITKAEQAKFDEYVKLMKEAGHEPAYDRAAWLDHYRSSPARTKEKEKGKCDAEGSRPQYIGDIGHH